MSPVNDPAELGVKLWIKFLTCLRIKENFQDNLRTIEKDMSNTKPPKKAKF